MKGQAGKASRQALTSAGLLALVATIGTALLAGVNQLTRERIAEQERLVMVRQLAEVLPAAGYDNDPLTDFITLAGSPEFNPKNGIRVYRARSNGRGVAAVFEHVAPDGYNGDIHLLTGILVDGTVSGVRVVTHKETPGLGDPIEVERSDWILGFNGRSLDNPPASRWGVRRDGGEFDQFTGATITPRAVVKAVKQALEYHQANTEKIYQSGEQQPDA